MKHGTSKKKLLSRSWEMSCPAPGRPTARIKGVDRSGNGGLRTYWRPRPPCKCIIAPHDSRVRSMRSRYGASSVRREHCPCQTDLPAHPFDEKLKIKINYGHCAAVIKIIPQPTPVLVLMLEGLSETFTRRVRWQWYAAVLSRVREDPGEP